MTSLLDQPTFWQGFAAGLGWAFPVYLLARYVREALGFRP